MSKSNPGSLLPGTNASANAVLAGKQATESAGIIPLTQDSSSVSSIHLRSINFTEEDRDRIIRIEIQLKELGHNLKLLLDRG